MLSDLGKVQERVYELKIKQVMTRDVVTVAPNCSIQNVKEILCRKRIASLPVVQDDTLVGIISLQDLLPALENGELSAPVSEHMTREVQAVRADESVVSAAELFAQSGNGRFPVVDARGRLVGILVQGDIVRGLLRQMESQWRAEQISHGCGNCIFEDIESDQTTLILRYVIKPYDFAHGGEATGKIKRALQRLGAPPAIVQRVAMGAYEAEMNLMIHSAGGEIIAEVQPERMRIIAVDHGPGIPDIAKALQPGYSRAPDWIRELGFGAGMGLTNIKSCADEMNLQSEVGVGTRLEIVFQLAPLPHSEAKAVDKATEAAGATGD